MDNVNVGGIQRALAEHRETLRRYSVRGLWIFGSVARGEATPESDIDFLVDLERRTFDDYMGLRCFLEDLFGRHIDLVTRQALRPELRDSITREAVHAA